MISPDNSTGKEMKPDMDRKQADQITEALEYKRLNFWAEIWRDFKKNKGAMIGLFTFIVIIAITILSEFLFDYDTQVIATSTADMLQSPSGGHLFGTDQYGRDILIRVLYGARYSLLIGICSVFVSVLVGSTLGIIAGYFGGLMETIIMRTMDVFSPIPSILLAVCLTTAFGQGLGVLMFSIGLVSVPSFAQVARASVLTIRDQEFIEAARASGAREYQIILSHVLPNALSPILVQSTLRVAVAIVTASALSFLGLGVPPPMPEWGGMLSDGRSFIRDYSYMTLFPGLAIMVTVLSINMVGDGLRDAMNPRLKR